MKRMIKALIADDESLFCEYLQTLIPWEEYGIEICAIARNGMEAMEFVNTQEPDIAFIDINMPYVDGLQFVEKTLLHSTNMKIVIVSGHDEFEYARKALKLGVVDYLLKPFSKKELIVCLMKVKALLQAEQKDRKNASIRRSLAHRHVVLQILAGELDQADEESREALSAGYLAINLNQPVFVCALHMDDKFSYWSDSKGRRALFYGVNNILCEIMGEAISFEFVRERKLRYALLINVSKRFDHSVIKQAASLCEKHLHITISMGIGKNYHDGVAGIRMSWLEALAALNAESTQKRGISYYTGMEQETLSIHTFSGGPPSKLQDYQKRVKDCPSLSRAQELVEDAIQYMQNSLHDEGLNIQSIADAMYVSASYLRKVFDKEVGIPVMSALMELRFERACQLISQDTMKLSDIAGMVGYQDPAYFSRKFKKKFGITPSEYGSLCRKVANNPSL